MADIELVIKVSEDGYKACQRKVKNPKEMLNEVDVTIANGISIPEEQSEKIIHCKDCKYRNYWGECSKWAKELDAHKTYLLDENMFCGFAEIEGEER